MMQNEAGTKMHSGDIRRDESQSENTDREMVGAHIAGLVLVVILLSVILSVAHHERAVVRQHAAVIQMHAGR
jgi:hypothetical protein